MHLDTTGSKVGTSLGPTQGRPPQQRNPSELEEHCRGVSWHKTQKAHRRLHDPGNGAGRGRDVSRRILGAEGPEKSAGAGGSEEWCFQVFKAFRPSVHRTHCTARRGSKSKS